MKKTVVLQSVCIFFISITSIIAFPGESYKEPASVKSFFSDTTPMVKTPATLKNRSEFTTQREMLDYLGAIHTTNKNTTVDLLGPTVKGNYLPIIMFSKEKKDKPTALLIAQQHGDEPMGCDVLLGTVKRIAHGDLNYLLEKIDIVIIPRVNPDGALPHYDILGLNTTNINYPQELKSYSTDILGKINTGLEKNSMSFNYYYNPFIKPTNGKPLVLYEATSSLNTARNFYGVQGSLSYLLELRGRGIGFENINRRLNSGLIGVEIILKDFYENSEKIKNLVKRNRDILKSWKKNTQMKEESKSYPLINIKKGTLENVPIIYIKN